MKRKDVNKQKKEKRTGEPDSRALLRMRKQDLLEIMLAQSREIDNLRSQVSELQKELADKKILIRQAGSIAEASLALTRIFDEAQKAADLYVCNVKRMTDEGETQGGNLSESATEEVTEENSDAGEKTYGEKK
ncbi:MAG: hypothetical protein SOI56_04485 [Eubacteriales bacterium]|jgi:dihydroorotate dehydrogenase